MVDRFVYKNDESSEALRIIVFLTKIVDDDWPGIK